MSRRNRQFQPVAGVRLPPALIALAALVGREPDDPELLTALDAAREHLRDYAGAHPEGIYRFVRTTAETGCFREGVAKAFEVDPGNIEADLLNGLGGPAFLSGLCLGFMVSANDWGGPR